MAGCIRGILVALALVVPAAARAGDMTPSELRDELVGRAILWWEAEGWRVGHLMLSADGSAEITVDRPGRAGDTGRWSIRGDAICTAWGSLRAQEKCYTVRRAEGGLFVTSGGNVFEVREAGA